MSDITCPNTACPVHFRNDHREDFQAGLPTRMISYVGKYAVMTTDNAELFSAEGVEASIKYALGLPGAVPPKLFTTTVLEVGEDGTLGPVADEGADKVVELERGKVKHGEMPTEAVAVEAGSLQGVNDWVNRNLQEQHELIVSQVKDGFFPA